MVYGNFEIPCAQITNVLFADDTFFHCLHIYLFYRYTQHMHVTVTVKFPIHLCVVIFHSTFKTDIPRIVTAVMSHIFERGLTKPFDIL